jgi:hypothetical protein
MIVVLDVSAAIEIILQKDKKEMWRFRHSCGKQQIMIELMHERNT